MVHNAQGTTADASRSTMAQAPAEPNASTGANAPADSKPAGQSTNTDQMREAMDNIDAATASAVAIDLVRGNKERATQRVALETGLAPQQVDQVMQGLGAKVEQYKASAKEAADQAAKYTAAAMWAAFVAALIALVSAALGGWMGARNVHRVYDYDVVA
jgi:hypothetical protein